MSLETFRPGESRAAAASGEGRRAQETQSSAPVPNSGGVSVDSTSGHVISEGWEVCGGGETQPPVQTGVPGEADWAVAEVGSLRSSVDLWCLDAALRRDLRQSTQRQATCHHATKRSEGQGDGPRGIKTPEKVRKLQLALYRKAKAEPKWRFWSLYGEISRVDLLEFALRLVALNKGGPGVDGESLDSILLNETTRQNWLADLQQQLQTKSYRPSPVRRVYIAKTGGGQRPLGIPTVRDRVVQMALYLVLMPIFEADFHPLSFGFRPKKKAHQALDTIVAALRSGRTEVVDADLSKYFDTIPHAGLLRAVARRVKDGSVLRLIKLWLRAPIQEEDKDGTKRMTPNRCGTPQGGVISPLLANLYLNPLDWAVNERVRGNPVLVRYADDFVILCGKGRGTELRERLQRWLERQGLRLNEQKTRLVNFRKEGFNFLGFHLSQRLSRRGQPYVHVEPGARARSQLRRRLREELNHWTLWRSVNDTIAKVNPVLRGWSGYFHYRNSSRVFSKIQWWVGDRMRRWLWRKSACTRTLWTDYPDEKLYGFYGLWKLPLNAPWTTKSVAV